MTSHVRVLGWSALFGLARGSSVDESREPEHVQVQHILIGFEGSVPGKTLSRTKAEAEELACKILRKSKKRKTNFLELLEEYSNNAVPGVYGIANRGVVPAPGEYPRETMMSVFTEMSFMLKIGEVGLVTFDPAASPCGYHVIKRLK